MADSVSREGGSYRTPGVARFIAETYLDEDDAMRFALKQLERWDLPRIQISAQEGKTLQTLLTAVQAEKVVEIGVLSGYSALWLLRGLAPAGRLWCVELDPRAVWAARETFARAGAAGRVELIEGAALAVLPRLASAGPFDAVFIDADKENYLAYAEWSYDNLRPGGLLIADNAYLFGYLAGDQPSSEWTPEHIAQMQEMHRFLVRNFTAVCLPTPDGMAVGVR